MSKFSKLIPFLSLCLIVLFGFNALNGHCENSFEVLRDLAEEGNRYAQFFLGQAYHEGDGVPKDLTEAAKWWRKAAEQGLAMAQSSLGQAYHEGDGVPKDLTEAAKWYRKAAEQGYLDAQYSLAFLYYKGEGISKNFAEAVKWWRKAAEQGAGMAQFFLGQAYHEGDGVPKDLTEAAKWYRKAAEQGQVYAQFNLAIAYDNGEGIPKDLTEAAKWYRKAAEQGYLDAQYSLAFLYYKGEGISKNFAEAVKWWRKAAEQGHAKAQYNLAASYYGGEGVPKDDIEALAWLNIAASTGDHRIVTHRERLERELGRQASLLSQQRSKEIIKGIESAKQKKAKTEEYGEERNAKLKGSGTGVFVTSDGLILTAAHVVGKSSVLKVATKHGLKDAQIVQMDVSNDLALLRCVDSSFDDFQPVPVKSSRGIKLGQTVFTIGFPNIEIQGFSPKMTKGEINSLSGLQDDPRHWQISVPVHPGNSGGPLFDNEGNLVGVVLSKLDAIEVAKATGDLPQNVSYAIKSVYAIPLLETNSSYQTAEILNEDFQKKNAQATPQSIENVVEKVQESVVLIFVY